MIMNVFNKIPFVAKLNSQIKLLQDSLNANLSKNEALEHEITLLKSLKIPKKHQYDAEEIARKDGSIWWCFKDLSKIPMLRGIALQEKLRLFEAGVNATWLRDRANNVIYPALWPEEAKDKGMEPANATDVETFRRELLERLHYQFDSEVLLEIAGIVIFKDDEIIEDISPEAIEAKVAEIRKHPELIGFFLETTFMKLAALSKDFEKHSPASLKKELAKLLKGQPGKKTTNIPKT